MKLHRKNKKFKLYNTTKTGIISSSTFEVKVKITV